MFDISKILTIGQTIELKLGRLKENKTTNTKVVDIINEDTFEILNPFNEISDIGRISIGFSFKVFAIKNEGVYEFNVQVINSTNKSISTLVIKVVSEINKIQRRNYYRLDVIKSFTGREVENLKEYKFGESFKGNIMDISAGGLLINSCKDLNTDNMIEIIFNLDDQRKFLLFGIILRKSYINVPNNKFEYGVKFVNITEFERNQIMKYIFEVQRKMLKKGLM